MVRHSVCNLPGKRGFRGLELCSSHNAAHSVVKLFEGMARNFHSLHRLPQLQPLLDVACTLMPSFEAWKCAFNHPRRPQPKIAYKGEDVERCHHMSPHMWHKMAIPRPSWLSIIDHGFSLWNSSDVQATPSTLRIYLSPPSKSVET